LEAFTEYTPLLAVAPHQTLPLSFAALYERIHEIFKKLCVTRFVYAGRDLSVEVAAAEGRIS